MLYQEIKFMKLTLIALLVLVGCSMTQGKYKKKFHLEDFQTTMDPAAAHALLAHKMKDCYPQSAYPVYEKTLSHFDVTSQTGTISYEIDNQSLGPQTLVLVEVVKSPTGSVVQVYAKGDLFRRATVYQHQIQKWLDGKKVDCDSRGQI